VNRSGSSTGARALVGFLSPDSRKLDAERRVTTRHGEVQRGKATERNHCEALPLPAPGVGGMKVETLRRTVERATERALRNLLNAPRRNRTA
jgi:hypothetical protein